MRISGAALRKISSELGTPYCATAEACNGTTWRHLPDAPDPSIMRRKANQFTYADGDTRDINTQTKIPSNSIPDILDRLRGGETMKAVGESYGVGKSAIFSIKKKYS